MCLREIICFWPSGSSVRMREEKTKEGTRSPSVICRLHSPTRSKLTSQEMTIGQCPKDIQSSQMTSDSRRFIFFISLRWNKQISPNLFWPSSSRAKGELNLRPSSHGSTTTLSKLKISHRKWSLPIEVSSSAWQNPEKMIVSIDEGNLKKSSV